MDANKILSVYKEVNSVSKTAKQLKIGKTTVRRYLTKNKILKVRPEKEFEKIKINSYKRFLNGENIKNICKNSDISATTLSRYIKSQGTFIKRDSKTLKKDLQKSYNYYLENKNLNIKSISDIFNIDRHIVSDYFKSKGYISNKHNKIKMKSDIFSEINTEEKAYWLGFIYADGYVSDANEFELALCLKDFKHLQKFRRFIERESKVKKDYYRCRVCLKDILFTQDLKKLGVVPRKSLILTFPDYNQVPKHLIKHFIRGYVDGDGSIYITNNNIYCSVLGTREFLTELIREAKIPRRTLYKNNNNNSSNCWFFQVSGKNAINLINYLYKNNKIHLERKYNKYLTYCRFKEKSLK